MTERPDHHGPAATEPDGLDLRVREALADHTADVEIAPDAYARLAAKVNDPSAQGLGQRLGSWFPSARGLVVATAGLAIVAGGLFALSGTEPDPTFQSADGSSDAATGDGGSGGATDGTGEPDDGDLDDLGEGGAGAADGVDESAEGSADGSGEGAPGDPDGAAAGLGPVRATKVEAAEAYLALLGIGFAEVSESGDGVEVYSYREGSTELFDRAIAEVDLVEIDGRWAVGSVASSSVSLTTPSAGQSVGGTFSVAGSGTGFEGTIDIEVRSVVDGSVLARASGQGGSLAEAQPFEAQVTVAGTERAWVIARSSGGADGVALPFTAVPVTIEGGPDPTPYVVATVEPDDTDGGLNVRSGPGAASEKIGLLPWAAEVSRTPGAFPTRIGDDVWWPISPAAGPAGWVNARFLAAQGPMSSEELNNGVQTFLFTASDPRFTSMSFPVSDRVGFTVVADGTITRLPATTIRTPEGWTSPVGPGTPSIQQLASLPANLDAEVTVTPNGYEFQDRSLEDVALTYFAGLPSVSATYPGSDGTPHAVHLFFEVTPVGPRYVGVILEPGL